MRGYLPTSEGEEKTYRVVYAVHKVLDVTSGSPEGETKPIEREKRATEFIGLITLRSLDDSMLTVPEDLTIPLAATATTLIVDLGYMFLPVGWGKGYATESLEAVLEAFKRTKAFWVPFSKVYIRALVNEENPASMRVMEKVGMVKRGIYEWTGEAIFLAGKWRERGNIHIFGMHLLG
jgi:RimJ/RimL family protein N-acetyltransferase